MPDFDVRLSAGVTVAEWNDVRANPQPQHQARGYVGTVGVEIEARATVSAVEAPADSGGLFSSDLGEWPAGHGPPSTSGEAGYSSIQHFTPLVAGHYMWVIRKDGEGALALHIEVH